MGKRPPTELSDVPHKRQKLSYALCGKLLLDEFFDAQDALAEGDTRYAGQALSFTEQACSYLEREYDTTRRPNCTAPPMHIFHAAVCNSLGEYHMDKCLALSGQCALAGSHRDAAQACFEKAVSAHPENVTARLSLINLHRDAASTTSLENITKLYEECQNLTQNGTPQKDAWYEDWVLERNASCKPIALYQLCLLYAQSCQFTKLKDTLKHFDVTYSISPEVWNLRKKYEMGTLGAPTATSSKVALKTGVIPDPILTKIRDNFQPSSPYWKATNYSSRGYFSFYYDPATPPRTHIEEAILLIIAQSGLPKGSVKATEWWIHTRLNTRDLGHQLHFDTEEKTLEANGTFLTPLKSTVTYLTGASSGGLTLCIDQSPDVIPSKKATEGYAVPPIDGGVLYFDGSLLHGVLPAGVGGKLAGAPQRLTLMVALWGTDDFTPSPEDAVGPQTPLPVKEEWVKGILVDKKVKKVGKVVTHKVHKVSAVWEAVKRKGEGGELLEVPKSIDQRFFAKSLDFKEATIQDHEARKNAGCGSEGDFEEMEEMEEEEEDQE